LISTIYSKDKYIKYKVRIYITMQWLENIADIYIYIYIIKFLNNNKNQETVRGECVETKIYKIIQEEFNY
jgi:hypothetical protein